MEYESITNLLGNTSDKVPRFITKNWIKVHDQSAGTYNTNKQIRFKKSLFNHLNCISKINNTLIDNAEDLDVVIPLYNLLLYGKNHRKQQALYLIITDMNKIVVQKKI